MADEAIKSELRKKLEDGYMPNHNTIYRVTSVREKYTLNFLIASCEIDLDDGDGNRRCTDIEAVIGQIDYERILERFIEHGSVNVNLHALLYVSVEDKYSEGGAGPEDGEREISCGRITLKLDGDIDNPRLYIEKL